MNGIFLFMGQFFMTTPNRHASCPGSFRLLAAGLAASAAIVLSLPAWGAASSFIGMGASTGTPSGDVKAAITPVLRTMEMPESVRDAQINPLDLFSVPVTVDFPRKMRIGIQASLGLTPQTRWLKYTLEEIQYVLGDDNVEILWLDDHSLDLGAQSEQLDFC